MTDYESLIAEVKRIAVLRSIGSVLGWDERTNMPSGGAELRAEQSSLIATMIHARFTSPVIGQYLASADALDRVKDPESDATVNVREIRRMYERACRMPGDLVEELARMEVLSEHAWADAKKKSDFAAFQPWLET